MDQNIQLASRLREVILNGTWIANTNFKRELEVVSWELAVKKQEGFNSIAMLTFHIQYYITGVLQFFENGTLEIKDKYSFDMPKISCKDDWEGIKDLLFSNTEKLAQLIEGFSTQDLDNTFVKKEYGTILRNIDGIIEHSYYHLGQIVLLKKRMV